MTASGLVTVARARSSQERARQRLLVVVAAVAGALALASARIARVGDLAFDAPFAPFVVQPGLRGGVVAGGVLVALPLVVFAVQALRLGSTQRLRRLTALRHAGATPGDLRRIAALQTGGAGLLGGALAGPVYLLLWAVLGVLPTAGWRLLPSPIPSDLLVWAGVALVVTLAGAAAGTATARRVRSTTHVRWGVVAAAAVLALAAGALSVVLGLVVAVVAVLLGFATPFAAWSGRRIARRGRPVDLLAGAWLTADPAPAGRVAAVLAVAGLALGVEGGLAAGVVARVDAAFYLAGSGLAGVATLVAVAVCVFALAVAAADQVLSGQRSIAALSALGVEPVIQRRVLYRRLTVVTVPAATAGALLGALLFGAGAVATGWPATALLLLPAVVTAGAVAVLAWLVTRALGSLLAEAADPENLRAA